MSSTRHATDGSFHQSRYCSSPEFQRGLTFTCVAPVARQILKHRPEDRELVWLIQWISHQEAGLAGLAQALAKMFPEKFGTRSMAKLSKPLDAGYSAEEIRQIRSEIPRSLADKLPLQGDNESRGLRISIQRDQAEIKQLEQSLDLDDLNPFEREDIHHRIGLLKRDIASNEACLVCEKKEAAAAPSSYPVRLLLDRCIAAAMREERPGECALEYELKDLLINPRWDWAAGGPWYFAGLVEALREYKRRLDSDHSGLVMTPVVKIIREFMDYTLAAPGLNLLTGPGNVGARYAVRELCRRQPGRVRVVDVPATNDDASFFRAIGRALGGNFTNYKNVQIRERASELLQSGDLALVLTSAQNLWPQKNLREAFPGRLAWLMEQTEAGASVLLISGPQFFMQKRAAEKSGWDSPEFAGRIHAAALPVNLSVADLTVIAQCALPQASADDCEFIALGAVSSERYLTSVDAVVKRVKYLSARAGRDHPTLEDVEAAIHFVSQSDNLLQMTRPGSSPRKSSRTSEPPEPISTGKGFARKLDLTIPTRITKFGEKESHV